MSSLFFSFYILPYRIQKLPFKNKDALYLACVEKSFADMAGAIQAEMDGSGAAYYDARQRFFKTHPMESRIFLEAAVDPPDALQGQIAALKRPLDDLNRLEFKRFFTKTWGMSSEQMVTTDIE